MTASVSFISSSSSLPPPLLSSKTRQTPRTPSSASLSLLTGSRTRTRSGAPSMHAIASGMTRPGLLHCSFLSSSSASSYLSLSSSFSGISLGLDFNFSTGAGKERSRGLVVRAGKAALCQTKRNRSRKSLARTHGFRRRMRTTSGRALLKRRRAKGRWVLCPKSNPNRGK